MVAWSSKPERALHSSLTSVNEYSEMKVAAEGLLRLFLIQLTFFIGCRFLGCLGFLGVISLGILDLLVF